MNNRFGKLILTAMTMLVLFLALAAEPTMTAVSCRDGISPNTSIETNFTQPLLVGPDDGGGTGGGGG